MICKGVVPEASGNKPCWLPADRSSCFQLCRRCHFHHVTRVVDRLTIDYKNGVLHPENELLLNNKDFLDDLLHPAREQALLNLLSTLHKENKIQFSIVLSRLKTKTVFSILITKRIQAHSCGTKCKMYQQFLKQSNLYTADSLCWNCWDCITWVLRKNDPHLIQLYIQSFGRHIHRLTYEAFQESGSSVFLDFIILLYMRKFDHHLRIVLHEFFLVFPLEEYRRFLSLIFQNLPIMHTFFTKEYMEMIPLPMRDESIEKDLRKDIYLFIKKRTDIYKEELMMRTWHPDRFIEWCFDLEERRDFD